MSLDESQAVAPSIRFFIELLALGCALGVVLVVLDVPIWVLYVAPLLGVPLLLRELRQLDHNEHAQPQEGGTGDTRKDGIAKELGDLEELRAAARRAQSRRDLEEIRMRQKEYEAQWRYERWTSLLVGGLWIVGAVSLGILGWVLSWNDRTSLAALGLTGLAVCFFVSRALGYRLEAWRWFRKEVENELEIQEARIGGVRKVDSVGGSSFSARAKRHEAS